MSLSKKFSLVAPPNPNPQLVLFKNLFYVSERFACMPVCGPHVSSAQQRAEERSDSLVLKLQRVVSGAVGAGFRTLVLWKSSSPALNPPRSLVLSLSTRLFGTQKFQAQNGVKRFIPLPICECVVASSVNFR